MDIRHKALLVHLLTATGSVLAMLAILAATQEKWSLMFLWLVVALVVDGVDGPLARYYDTPRNWPLYDGNALDLIIDFLTYVFIPAFALFESDLLPGWTGWLATIAITYASGLYFVDTRMKTGDKSFAGFPACWNMVVLVLFTLAPSYWVVLGVVLLLTLTMFTNIKFIHPVRTTRWRKLSFPVFVVWTICAGWAAWTDFNVNSYVHIGLLLSSLYLISIGAVQQIFPPHSTR